MAPDLDGGDGRCGSDSDCTDGLFCTGVERCAPDDEAADARGCLPAAEPGCAADRSCDEAGDVCRMTSDCAEPDADGDNHDAIACGGDDCDDTDASRYPGATEVCDGDDEDCDDATFGETDLDGDEFVSRVCCNGDNCGTDCDDAAPGVNPEVPDPCDEVDNDCDGAIDEGGTLFRDADNDGRGDPAIAMTGGCMVGWVFNADDCDDVRSETYEGARERCDGRDNDCGDALDPGGLEPSEDADGDGHSPVTATCLGRDEPGDLGWEFEKDDCDDADGGTYPGATELCGDEIDQDCDRVIDNPTQRICDDVDGDGRGDATTRRNIPTCVIPPGSVPDAACDDCNDARATAFPGNREICDRIDNDCSSGGGVATDEDVDSDGYAPAGASCVGRGEADAPATALPKGDCGDANPAVHPGASEYCDGTDSDCSSGGVAMDEDADGDYHAPISATCIGFGEPGGSTAYPKDDCDDVHASAYPGRPASDEIGMCDGVDNDCNPSTSELAQRCATGGNCLPSGMCGRGRQVLEVSAGTAHTCARLGDGTVHCWGSNDNGQLGDGTTTNRTSPTLVPGLTGVVELSAGGWHTCARLGDGTVRCWGRNSDGQLGDGTTTRATSPTTVLDLSGVVELSAGRGHTCARLRDGTARCWGANFNGQLGDGTTTDRTTPTPVRSLSGVVELGAGSNQTCALLGDGTARCWGSNNSGELGDGTTSQQTVPTRVLGLSGAVELSTRYSHACARLGDGTVSCWGSNFAGQLGDGSLAVRTSPTPVPGLSGVVELSAGFGHTCARKGDGTAHCWGRNSEGQLGDGTTMGRISPTRVLGLSGVAELTAGGNHTCARLGDGTLRCWGLNSSGQLGDDTTINRVSATAVRLRDLSGVVELTTGDDHTCALMDDGTARCWGGNYCGQLGDGTLTNRASPTPVTGLIGVVELSAGAFHTCARLGDGTVRCWGCDYYGQAAGTVSGDNLTSPTVVPGLSGVVELSAGYEHTCARLGDGTVRCWGNNGSGRLGDGTLTGVVELSAGNEHTCARLGDGTASCWGRNSVGQLGDGTSTSRTNPMAVSGLTGVVELSASMSHTCARLVDGTVRCWGANYNGSLGDGTITGSRSPIAVRDLTAAVELTTGSYFTCAGLGDGTARCWGYNSYGQMGDGTTTEQHSPVVVRDLIGIVQLSGGGNHTCALLGYGTVRCWGRNSSGQVGDGTIVNRLTPTLLDL